jgi:predicted SnoaL-like aldol condensation-catalyzing enzyme
MADGDLVFVAHMGAPNTDPIVDPAASFAGNVLRVEHGKIVEWWYTGLSAAPATPPTAAAENDGARR